MIWFTSSYNNKRTAHKKILAKHAFVPVLFSYHFDQLRYGHLKLHCHRIRDILHRPDELIVTPKQPTKQSVLRFRRETTCKNTEVSSVSVCPCVPAPKVILKALESTETHACPSRKGGLSWDHIVYQQTHTAKGPRSSTKCPVNWFTSVLFYGWLNHMFSPCLVHLTSTTGTLYTSILWQTLTSELTEAPSLAIDLKCIEQTGMWNKKVHF